MYSRSILLNFTAMAASSGMFRRDVPRPSHRLAHARQPHRKMKGGIWSRDRLSRDRLSQHAICPRSMQHADEKRGRVAVSSRTMPYFPRLLPGDPAPWFHQRPAGNAQGFFDAAAGRYIVLCFFGTIADAMGRSAIDAAVESHALFDDVNVSFFGVSLNRVDELESAVSDRFPGLRFLWDFDGAVSKLCGTIQRDAEPGPGKLPVRRLWVVLDPTQPGLKVTTFSQDDSPAKAI